MSDRRALRAWFAGLLLLASGRAPAEDAYPTDITPPEGTRYPCALTALPRGLPGIPAFAKAVALREAGRGLDEAYGIAEGRLASARLIAAWSRMQARYPSWPTETRESVYHHLCALDLF